MWGWSNHENCGYLSSKIIAKFSISVQHLKFYIIWPIDLFWKTANKQYSYGNYFETCKININDHINGKSTIILIFQLFLLRHYHGFQHCKVVRGSQSFVEISIPLRRTITTLVVGKDIQSCFFFWVKQKLQPKNGT